MSKAENDGEELFAARVGDRLAAARKAAGLSLEDIVLRTRIPRRHLEMIEAGNHSALPAITYSAGFVKTYAQLLGLDGAELSRDFRAEVSEVEQVRHSPAPFEPADPARMPSRFLAFVALGIAIIFAVVYLVWRGGALTADERASMAAGTVVEAEAPVMPTAKPVAPPAAAPQPSGAIALTAVQPVWLKIYEKGGPTLFMGEMAVGQRFDVPATAIDPQIWTGRPQAVQVTIGGKPVPPLGKADQTIRDVSLKRDALLARTAAAPVPATAAAPTPAARPAQVTPVDPASESPTITPSTTEPAPRP